ncbi:MAG: lipid A biosynthesis acyltransferase [Brachymonas sp.]|nr:lipid A biosynthesis acyltransferase [Brachymonas sp.]
MRSRRKIVQRNLSLCFSEHSAQEIRRLERNIFIFFAQSWLDRSWLWHGSHKQLKQRLQLSDEATALAQSSEPTVLFAPHFMGLDAGWTALNSQLAPSRAFSTIYAPQNDATVDAWILQGRQQHGTVRLFSRQEGVREIASSLKSGVPLYLLPDMDMGSAQSEFVPFFGVNTCTVTSLPRFARLAGAQVRSVQTLLTPSGYRIEISKPWSHYPGRDVRVDTARMNTELEQLVKRAPDQYYWVHKRFKTRPPGEPSLY